MNIKKLLLVFLFFIITNTVYAGSYENALSSGKNVFLYMYAKDCRTCKVFDSIYNNLKSENNEYKFVKVDVNTPYGRNLIMKYRGMYVPFIVLTNSKSNKSVKVTHSCVMDEMCLMRAMKSFNG